MTIKSMLGFDVIGAIFENETSVRFSLGVQESAPPLEQMHYRFRTDGNAVDATPTWGADEDTP